MLTIKECRKKLGKFGKNKTDEEIGMIEEKLRTLANIAIDQVLVMSPKERKTIDRK